MRRDGELPRIRTTEEEEEEEEEETLLTVYNE